MKGDLEAILDLTGKLSEIEFRAEAIPALHPGQSAAIYLDGKRVGFIGVVHPELERKLDLNGRTIVFELEWSPVADRVIPQARTSHASRQTAVISRLWSLKMCPQQIFWPNVRKLA